MRFDEDAFHETRLAARDALMAWRRPEGVWQGRLSSSALSTATAVFALATADKKGCRPLIRSGLKWLAENSNADGGWGDTVLSPSNISTTLLVWSAFAAAEDANPHEQQIIARAEAWLVRYAGSLDPDDLVSAVIRRYGKDRTFAVPILTMCALAGRLGSPAEAWRQIPALPFELAACPRRWLRMLRLHVVSYALPALIAIGQVHYHHRRPRNPLTRVLRRLVRNKTLDLLRSIQPADGGFLEAIPLTSFVVLSLAAAGQKNHAVVHKGVEFLTSSMGDDGSWPIDKNLTTWVTTLSVNALAVGPDFSQHLPSEQQKTIRDWLLAQQHRETHPFTHADPGGWAWTDLSGGVPDADDTAGALLALRNLGPIDDRVIDAAATGVRWLLDLQNRDGGIPTFCRGWGKLPFDRSSPDLTAHALLALATWQDDLPASSRKRTRAAVSAGLTYLARVQRSDGAWVPLWFGNALAESEQNPTYGTARVLCALHGLGKDPEARVNRMLAKGLHWLVSAQNPDGGWGGAPSVPSSIEETAVTVDALARVLTDASTQTIHALTQWSLDSDRVKTAVLSGAGWLIEHTDKGTSFPPSPIGLYFARLWYFERLYPVSFAVSALERVASCGVL